jgi:hypothetical protein
MTKDKIIVTAGEFDPLTLKDLIFLQKCKKKGDWLIVGVHSDMWMQLCRGGYIHNYNTRHEIIENLKCVDEVFKFNDGDGTACNLLRLIKHCYPLSDIRYLSNQNMHNMPETKIRGITFEVLK